MPTYTTEAGVYSTTGLSSELIQRVTQLPEAEVTTLVNGFIDKAEVDLKEDIRVPYTIRKELHLGTGYDNIFELGPWDEEFSSSAEYDPTDGVMEVSRLYFSKYRKQRPYPTDCELNTDRDPTLCWTETNAVLTGEQTIVIHGNQSIKAVFSDAGYAQTPCGVLERYLDKQIGLYTYLFFWFRTDDRTKTFSVRLYNTDGNYEEATFSPRQSDVGQFFWINIGAMTGSIDWGNTDTRLQYIRFYVSGACTIYIDNLCFADEWAYSAPIGYLHIAKADNISGSGFPSYNYPFYATYSYDPFLASTPSNIQEATEWLTGVKVIDHLRMHKYGVTDFYLEGDTLEPDTPMQRSGMLGVRSKFLEQYQRCLKNYGGVSYGVI